MRFKEFVESLVKMNLEKTVLLDASVFTMATIPCVELRVLVFDILLELEAEAPKIN